MSRVNSYTNYPEFIDYIMYSGSQREYCYQGLVAIFIPGTPSVTDPSAFSVKGMTSYSGSVGYGYPLQYIYDKFSKVAPKKVDLPAEMGSYPINEDSYEEALNVPAAANISSSPRLDELLSRADREAILKDIDLSEESSLSAKLFYIDWSSGYDSSEYLKYGIEETPLNSSAATLSTMVEGEYSGSNLVPIQGCLVGVEDYEYFFPLGYIEFSTIDAGNVFSLEADSRGLISLK